MPLPRLQLFEFNDAARVPDVIREAVIETLAETLERGGILDGLAPIFAEFVGKADASEVLDLCAGAGNPARILVRAMLAQGTAPPNILLTDLFPRTDAWYQAKEEFPEHISFVRESVDATALPAALSSGRARTIINAFHHLPPELAQRVLDDAISSRSPILVAECFGRNPLGFVPLARRGLATLAGNPLFARHHRFKRALLTWVVPVIPAIAIWDGLVSTMRVYTEDDLRAMTAHAGDTFEWVYRTWEFPWGGVGRVFYGIPVSK